MLHSTILHYTILYYIILFYSTLHYTILYRMILYYTVLYYTILHYAILYNSYYTLLYYTILYCIITLYYITPHKAILYCIILYPSRPQRPPDPAWRPPDLAEGLRGEAGRRPRPPLRESGGQRSLGSLRKYIPLKVIARIRKPNERPNHFNSHPKGNKIRILKNISNYETSHLLIGFT